MSEISEGILDGYLTGIGVLIDIGDDKIKHFNMLPFLTVLDGYLIDMTLIVANP